MKRKLFIGILTATLVIGLGTSALIAYAQDGNWNPRAFMQQRGVDVEQADQFMREQGIDVDQMYQIMGTGDYDQMQQFMQNQNINFGQMLPQMKQMHPELSTEELQDLYESMHGTGGSFNSKNFQGMMGNFRQN